MLNLKQGSELISLARKSIESAFGGKHADLSEIKKYPEKQGVFVTLHNCKTFGLRGCIGFVSHSLPLGRAVAEAAKASAFSDPRFMPLQKNEFGDIVIEISVLTKSKDIGFSESRENMLKDIKIGEDGLIVSSGRFYGLLLPQVATEQGWQAKEFLENACLKAGLGKDAWKEPDCKIYKFQAQIFSETKPNGKVVEKKPACNNT